MPPTHENPPASTPASEMFGCDREVRPRGLLPCCREMLTRCTRVTRVDSEAECPTCHAVVQVDDAGAWSWRPFATSEAIRRTVAYS